MEKESFKSMGTKLLECRDLLECILKLNPFEVDIFRSLSSQGPQSADEIGKRFKKDRSTAYRALRQLISCQICYKERVNLENGGYKFIYHAVDPRDVQDEMETRLEEWIDNMRNAIQTFPQDMAVSLKDEKVSLKKEEERTSP